jgi:hypothetical protein
VVSCEEVGRVLVGNMAAIALPLEAVAGVLDSKHRRRRAGMLGRTLDAEVFVRVVAVFGGSHGAG